MPGFGALIGLILLLRRTKAGTQPMHAPRWLKKVVNWVTLGLWLFFLLMLTDTRDGTAQLFFVVLGMHVVKWRINR